ncbi:MAG TPA: dTMP kinase [Candidatus Omnitrophota bacterium]|jgi:dTMP kinase|nr:MAG: Thymidylate kinase [Candidatus Omnitrophica bacterium ADurb.Bin314]HQB94499.1 dTMP kinase [Candidatus Omnitrophota bacterium]
MKKGVFITFEGAEGSGKSTQIRNAASFFRHQKRQVVLLREPGGTRISEAIRSVLLDRGNRGMSHVTELLLYLSARAQIVHEKILPALRSGKVVICDRFEDSTLAYQGYGRGIPLPLIREVSRLVRGTLRPDLTFVLDIDIKKGLSRGGRHDRIEREAFSFHQKVRRGFLALARKEPRRVIVVDSGQPLPEVSRRVLEKLQNVFGE